MDYNLYRAVNGLSGETFPDGVMKFLANDLPGILVVLVALTFLLPGANRRAERRRGALLGTASAALALLLSQPVAHLVDRPRPYLAHRRTPTYLLISRSHDPSFPSDHATGAFALAFGIWLYDRTIGTVLLVLAGILSFSRVYVGTHYPGDVVAGALIGAAVAAAFNLIAPTRRLIEAVARRCGEIWDGLLNRLVARGRA